jgi:hypothetical protein
MSLFVNYPMVQKPCKSNLQNFRMQAFQMIYVKEPNNYTLSISTNKLIVNNLIKLVF